MLLSFLNNFPNRRSLIPLLIFALTFICISYLYCNDITFGPYLSSKNFESDNEISSKENANDLKSLFENSDNNEIDNEGELEFNQDYKGIHVDSVESPNDIEHDFVPLRDSLEKLSENSEMNEFSNDDEKNVQNNFSSENETNEEVKNISNENKENEAIYEESGLIEKFGYDEEKIQDEPDKEIVDKIIYDKEPDDSTVEILSNGKNVTKQNPNIETEENSESSHFDSKDSSSDSSDLSSDYQKPNDTEQIFENTPIDNDIEQNFDASIADTENNDETYVTSNNKKWMPMMKENSDCCLIYSAYYDTRKSFMNLLMHKEHIVGFIRIIGIIDRNMQDTFYCHLKYLDDMVLTIEAISGEINEAHEGLKTAGFILCPIIGNPEDHVALPISVGASLNQTQGDVNDYVNFIDISYERFYEDKKERNIAVCPGPVFKNFNNALRVAEFIEMYKLLGATKFYIYELSIGEEVKKLMDFYVSEGTVEILKWNLEDFMELREESIHYNGIIASLNDCFYHATFVDDFKYFIHSDFDEIIFPYEFTSLTEFLKQYDDSQFNSFNFFNYFFFPSQRDFSNVPESSVNKFLFTQSQIQRLQDAEKHHERSKYIAKANSVFEVGNHFMWSTERNTQEFTVNISLGALHHYRDKCSTNTMNYCEYPTEKENYARKFGEILWKNVDKVCEIFDDGICPMGWVVPDIMKKRKFKKFVG